MDLIFGSFRPVSNLTFLSKLIEHVAAVQLMDMAQQTGNYEELQSAYQNHHSTETALLKVKTDILENMDNGRVNFLIMLDLSAAFDMISFDFLTNQLQHRFGMNRTVLTWITNYLKGHVQRVVVNNTHSDLVNLIHGVPQGSVLGPLLFSLFILPLGDICRNHNILFHSYTDDQQVYLSFDPSIAGNENLCIKKIETCIQDIRVWMKTNLLKLNDRKMEVIKIGTRQKLSRCDPNSSVQIGNDNIIATSSVQNLGYYWNLHMKDNVHVNKITSCVFLTVRNILKIRHLLDTNTTKMLVQALVLSKID